MAKILEADAQLCEGKGFDVIVAPIGTGLTLVGLAEGFQSHFGKPAAIVGARCSHRQEIPGMRDDIGLQEVKQPWGKFTNYLIDVDRRPAFLCTPWMDWAGDFPVGPSSGGTYVAACKFIRQVLTDETLEGKIRNPKTGKIRVGIVLHDGIDVYPGDRFSTDFPEESLHPSTADLPEKIIFG